jgi:hypothetical protein
MRIDFQFWRDTHRAALDMAVQQAAAAGHHLVLWHEHDEESGWHCIAGQIVPDEPEAEVTA